MIVHPIADALICITQPDHARLAAQVMAAWRADGFAERASRSVTLLAIARHDDGWEEEDARPLLDPSAGRPFDYLTLPSARRDPVWQRSIAAAAGTSAYAAALIAQHYGAIARTVGRGPAWEALATTLESQRDAWFTSPPVGPVDPPVDQRLLFLRDYASLAMADLLSLMACDGRRTWAERDGYELRLEADGRITVAPDPFGGRELHLDVPARRLGPEACVSQEALDAAWARAAVEAWPAVFAGRALPEPS